MSDALISRPHRRHPMELQLTAMIDIFSMIVIFLILGAVFGAADIVVPKGLKPPRSISKEMVDSAPRIVIEAEGVTSSLFDTTVPFSEFKNYENSATIAQIMANVKKFTSTQNKSGKPVLLNVIADQDTPYERVFEVVKVFQLSGFDALLFLAEGMSK